MNLTDIEDIQRLIFLYGHIIDDKQWDRLDEIFAVDGSFEVEGTEISVSGLGAIEKYIRGNTNPLAHFSTNVLIDLEDGADVATASVKFLDRVRTEPHPWARTATSSFEPIKVGVSGVASSKLPTSIGDLLRSTCRSSLARRGACVVTAQG